MTTCLMRNSPTIALRAALLATPHPPNRPNPEPDGPGPIAPDDEEDIPSDGDDDDAQEREPGRTVHALRRMH